jgi:hypothetical protein
MIAAFPDWQVPGWTGESRRCEMRALQISPRRTARVVCVATVAALGACAIATATAQAAAVNVFPMPGSRVAPPRAQIVFRGVAPGAIGSVTVKGSRSGTHKGTIRADSDGQGASFIPAKPFTAGEQVTVRTHLAVIGGNAGTFRFSVSHPVGGFAKLVLPTPPARRGDVSRFHSRPDLVPAAVEVRKRTAAASSDDIFAGPQQGPVQKGPMILGPDGRLIYFKAVPRGQTADDFRVQTYRGRPVLTWWQGSLTATGIGLGVGVVEDQSYRRIAVVHAGNGLRADLHEFRITSRNTALITAYAPIIWNASAAHGSRNQVVLDAVVQEIDIPTGLVLYQWDSLDHVSVADSQLRAPRKRNLPFDYFHINSIDPDADGSLIVSSRNTSTAFKVAYPSGGIIWRLGGKHSTFKLGPGASFGFQHDVRSRAADDSIITLFDNGGGPPRVHRDSSALALRLDLARRTATRIALYGHSPRLVSNYEGDYQLLANLHAFVGWGQQGWFTEYDTSGHVVFDAHFVPTDSNYRVYRLPWAGFPRTAPAVAITGGKNARLYVSWNGATAVSRWRLLTGSSATALTPGATVGKSGFETSIAVPKAPLVAVQGLDASGHVLGTSRAIKT